MKGKGRDKEKNVMDRNDRSGIEKRKMIRKQKKNN